MCKVTLTGSPRYSYPVYVVAVVRHKKSTTALTCAVVTKPSNKENSQFGRSSSSHRHRKGLIFQISMLIFSSRKLHICTVCLICGLAYIPYSNSPSPLLPLWRTQVIWVCWFLPFLLSPICHTFGKGRLTLRHIVTAIVRILINVLTWWPTNWSSVAHSLSGPTNYVLHSPFHVRVHSEPVTDVHCCDFIQLNNGRWTQVQKQADLKYDLKWNVLYRISVHETAEHRM